jgi:hypothetical protein
MQKRCWVRGQEDGDHGMADACPNGSRFGHRTVWRLSKSVSPATRMHRTNLMHPRRAWACSTAPDAMTSLPPRPSRRNHAKSFLATLLPSRPIPGDSALRFIAPLPLRGGLPRVSSGARARGRSSARGLGSEDGAVGLGYDEKNRCRRAWSMSARCDAATHLCCRWTRRWIIA